MFKNTKAFNRGKRDYKIGILRDGNPYTLSKFQGHRVWWFKGWDEANKFSKP